MRAKQGKFRTLVGAIQGSELARGGWKTPKITKMKTKILNKR